jgi:hypothetical protein
MKLAGGPRMVAHWEPPELTLLAMGGHETTTSLSVQDIRRALPEREPAPGVFLPETPSKFFLRTKDQRYRAIGPESSPEWLYFLDDEQTAAVDSIYEAMVELLTTGEAPRIHFVLGGPGTGKTSILLNLLKRLDDGGVSDLMLELPEQVASYVRSATSIDLSRYMSTPEDQSTALARMVEHILERHCKRVTSGALGALVVALDPLQLDQPVEDKAFRSIVRRFEVATHQVRACYRQKEAVGKQTVRVITQVADSSPFVDPGKIKNFRQVHLELTQLSNSMEFRNPHGYTDARTNVTSEEFTQILSLIKSHPAGMWKHWPSVAVVLADPHYQELPRQWRTALDASRINHTVVGEREISSIKGVEFQHVLVVIGPELYAQLEQGFEGSGQAVYNRRRLLRIPFSRARDSLITLVPKGARRVTAGKRVFGTPKRER